MIQVTVAEAQARLPELVELVRAGEGMEIYGDGGWIFRVGAVPPLPAEGERPATGFGCCRGMIWMADDFDAPLDEMREYRFDRHGVSLLRLATQS